MQKLLLVIIDGLGERLSSFGNVSTLCHTPSLNFLKKHGYAQVLEPTGKTLAYHNSDMGNSEVGQRLGAGQVFMQGSSLVDKAIADESLLLLKLGKSLKS